VYFEGIILKSKDISEYGVKQVLKRLPLFERKANHNKKYPLIVRYNSKEGGMGQIFEMLI